MATAPPGKAYVSRTLKDVGASLSKKDARVARSMFDHYQQAFVQLRIEEAPSVAASVHATVDEGIDHMLAKNKHPISCGKGCSACCRIEVEVFPQEAVLLRLFAVEEGVLIDEAKLARQATAANWRDLSPEDRACVFLGADGACRVYDHRPGACRKYFVTGDPDLCDMDKYPGGKVGILFSLDAEIMHSAAMTAYGSGRMARMLLKHAAVTTQENPDA